MPIDLDPVPPSLWLVFTTIFDLKELTLFVNYKVTKLERLVEVCICSECEKTQNKFRTRIECGIRGNDPEFRV